jgi:tetratricopeptide (TPR) repeat protein
MEQAHSTPVVEDLVRALSGVDGDAAPAAALAARMKHAASRVDEITAQVAARALIGELCQDPLNLRRLEALLVLGMAHPALLARHGIDVRREGERLALLLEHEGRTERAAAFRETIDARFPAHQPEPAVGTPDTPVRVDALLREAASAVAEGRTRDALRLLQSVLTVDPTRKDVARMIRDLHYEKAQKRRHLRRAWLAASAVFVLLAATGVVVRRERSVAAEWAHLPAAVPQDLAALEARHAAVDDLLERRGAWLGMASAVRERNELERHIQQARTRLAEDAARVVEELRERRAQAELLRDQARLAAERGDYTQARSSYSRALEIADADWEHRDRTERDTAAITAWLAARETR